MANKQNLKIGQKLHGFEVKRIEEVADLNAFFYELEHVVTGARYIHIEREDRDNAFGVAFKTVPKDSTGVAHILEHTILTGSEKFPVHDPFFSMIRRSLNTFMNAFTASDWTMYPFSAYIKEDFYNLMDVYLDAVFFPTLNELSFKQEGWRLDFEGDDLVYKGVVYNEMKGAMSSPDRILEQDLLSSLYPDTTYHYNSGGEPRDIPKLTYEEFKNFHKEHYNPSNAFFYSYGDLPLEGHLEFVENNILKKFDKKGTYIEVESQPRWDSPKEKICKYHLDKEEDYKNQSQVTLSWLTADIKDSFENLILVILERVLLGNSGAPLYKALIDSGLGSSLSDGYGLDADFSRDTLFSIGLKGTEKEHAKKIEKIILKTLEDLVEKGIDKNLIEQAIHKLEFEHKEIVNEPYTYGITVLFSFLGTWLHGGDALSKLNFDKDLQKIKQETAKGKFLEQKIKEYFLDNKHRVLLSLVPDSEVGHIEEARVKKELETIKNNLSEDEKEQIKKQAQALVEMQDQEENIDCLPTLKLKDIPASPKSLEKKSQKENINFYEVNSKDIFYFDSLWGVGNVSEDVFKLLPFFCYSFSRIGTTKNNYVDFGNLIDRYTGGITCSAEVYTDLATKECLPVLHFDAKCLNRNQEKMFSIVSELLSSYDFSDTKHLKELLLKYKSSVEVALLPKAHLLAVALASRNISKDLVIKEAWSGVHQLLYIKELVEKLDDEKLEKLSADLNKIAKSIFFYNNSKIALTGEEKTFAKAEELVKGLEEKLEKSDKDYFSCPKVELKKELVKEAWSTTTAISFVASTWQTVDIKHPDAPALTIAGSLINSLFIHRELREKGGAYGGVAKYYSENGLFVFTSYRDPRVVRTLETYDKAYDFIFNGKYNDENIKEAILRACSMIDRPEPPSEEAFISFIRELIKLDDKDRKEFKEKLVKVNKEDIQRVVKEYFKKERNIAIISNKEKIEQVNQRLADKLEVKKI